MDTTCIVHRRLVRLSNSSRSGLSIHAGHLGVGHSRVPFGPRNCFGKLSCQFSDSGHLQYYVSPRGCASAKKKEKDKSCEIKGMKKKLKLIRRLSKDLSMFCHVEYGEETRNSLMGEDCGTMGPEETLVLLAQLQQFKLKQKELMRKMEEEKAQLKATSMKAKAKRESESSSTSSSSSSDSSDSECGEVIHMNRLGKKTSALERLRNSKAFQEAAIVANPAIPIQQENSEEVLAIGDSSFEHRREDCCSRADSECSSSNGCNNDQRNTIVEGASANKIEICMGGKCKKLGAVALLEEFERKVGVEGAVVGCKCMGKCRDGPNVRVSDIPKGVQAKSAGGSVRAPSNPLCIGVGLEDVGVIVANLLGKDMNDKCLMDPC